MAPKENESTIISYILKEMANVEEQIKTSLENNEVYKTDNNNNTINDSNDQVSEKSFWQRTSELMEQMEQEWQTMSEGKDVKFLEREDFDEEIRLNFELVGLSSEEIKISMTESNFLEIEYLQKIKDNNEEGGPSYIWAYPLEQGLKVAERSHIFTEGGQKLIVTVPKDPNYQPEEEKEEEEGTIEEISDEAKGQGWDRLFWPYTMIPVNGEEQVQIVKPIEANIDENEEQFQIEIKIGGFQADEINVQLCQSRVLNVTGERKKKNLENPEISENEKNQVNTDEENSKLSRKLFGRMFWIPDGCKKEEIVAQTRMEDSILILTITVPKGLENLSLNNGEETREIPIRQQ